MSAPDLPTCTFSAYHRDYAPHIFHCDLPVNHDGKHGHQVADGVWLNWDITAGFDPGAPHHHWPVIGVVDADGRVLQGDPKAFGLPVLPPEGS